jgi:hypothetical protein
MLELCVPQIWIGGMRADTALFSIDTTNKRDREELTYAVATYAADVVGVTNCLTILKTTSFQFRYAVLSTTTPCRLFSLT